MNQSGRFVKNTLKALKYKPEELLIVHDDSDIELGKYKISFGRGAAGHKGVQSIIDELKAFAKGGSPPKADAPLEHATGGKNFWRIRIGIRPISNNKHGFQPQINTDAISINQHIYQHKSASLRKKASEFVLKKISKKDWDILGKVFNRVVIKIGLSAL